jgi:hypothetical protein
MNQIQSTARVGVASACAYGRLTPKAEASLQENEITTISLPHENYIRSQKSNLYSIAASVGVAAIRQSRRCAEAAGSANANEAGNRYTRCLGHRSHLEHGHCRSP